MSVLRRTLLPGVFLALLAACGPSSPGTDATTATDGSIAPTDAVSSDAGAATDAFAATDSSVGTDAGSTDAAPPPDKRIFVTEEIYDGDLVGALGGATGLESGDQACQQAAAAAALGGTWKAWLSDSSTLAVDRMADVGPWYRLDGVKVFDSRADMMGVPLVPIDVTEHGVAPTPVVANVWTGARFDGTGGLTCSGWTSSGVGALGTAGQYTEIDSSWTDVGWPALAGNSCSGSQHLYCVEQ